MEISLHPLIHLFFVHLYHHSFIRSFVCSLTSKGEENKTNRKERKSKQTKQQRKEGRTGEKEGRKE